MGSGSTVWIGDANDRSSKARVVEGRLLVSALGGGGGGGDVNITEIGGSAVAGPNLPVDIENRGVVVDAGNSTTVALLAGASFVGTFVDCEGFGSVSVVVNTDADSAVDGFQLEFSTDGVNVDDGGITSIVADEPRRVVLTVTAKFFRVNYTNGGDAQSFLRLQTLLHTQGQVTAAHKLEDDVDPTRNNAQLVKAALIAQVTPGGAFTPIQANAAGILKIGGSVDVDVVVPGTGATELGKAEDAPHTTGDVGVMALAVRNDSGGFVGADRDYSPLRVDSTARLIVRPLSGDPTDFVSTVRVRDGNNGADFLSIVEAGDTATSFGDPFGNVPLSVARDPEGITAVADDEFVHLVTDLFARLRVHVGAPAADSIAKLEDAAHVTADVGVGMLAVRQDTLASSVSTDGDYGFAKADVNGALWVRSSGVETIETLDLSGSTRGRPIQITATATLGTTLHAATTTAGEQDRIFIDLTNTSTAAVLVTIEFGAAGAGNQILVQVPPEDTLTAIDGKMLGGAATDTITAFAATGSVINAIGRVERITQP